MYPELLFVHLTLTSFVLTPDPFPPPFSRLITMQKHSGWVVKVLLKKKDEDKIISAWSAHHPSFRYCAESLTDFSF